MHHTERLLENPHGKQLSLQAVLTCTKIASVLGVLIVLCQIPVSALTFYGQFHEGSDVCRSAVQNTSDIEPAAIILWSNSFVLDSWFPGVLLGAVIVISSKWSARNVIQATEEITTAQNQRMYGEYISWTGLAKPPVRTLSIMLMSSLSAFAQLIVSALGFGMIQEETGFNGGCWIRVFLLILHIIMLVLSVPAYILTLYCTTSVCVISNNCSSCGYPYPVYLNFSRQSRAFILPGPRKKTNEI
ncbi:uncharacterized protein LOC129598699 [Paramacrobiotus metropolitanus]|uniref:uncharacterized protein LOC129598699 n=1 Tax=Paramacrobiotus metropolitanus TaxID=2943436 RepID=UPI00244568EE|nr:uncharacterized protein LOC129598699 [Paramacrobiotus metropolitanus]